MNPYGVPEMSVVTAAQRLADGDDLIVLDVREPHEVALVSLGDAVALAPLSQLAARRELALPETVADKNAEILVICHHGNRSLQVAAWLRQQGWTRVYNLTGGLDAYAVQVDPSIGRY